MNSAANLEKKIYIEIMQKEEGMNFSGEKKYEKFYVQNLNWSK